MEQYKQIIPNTTNIIDEAVEQFKQTNKQMSVPAMNGLNTEFAHGNRWIGYVPIQNVLGKNYSNIELNLTRFSIPQIQMGSTDTSFKSYQYKIPTKVMDAGSKEITFEYIIDEKWQNYKSLYTWMTNLEGNINKVDNGIIENPTSKDTLDVRVWLIDNFKNRIIDFVFCNSWILTFQDLNLETNNPHEVHHSFTMVYSNFYIADASQTYI